VHEEAILRALKLSMTKQFCAQLLSESTMKLLSHGQLLSRCLM
jgi:hypothetical protein